MKNIRSYLIPLFLLSSVSFAENVKENKIIPRNEPEIINIGKTEDYFRFYTGGDVTDLGQPGLPRYFNLLGLSNYHTLITLDGRKINSFLDGNANLNQIPAGLVENIKIKKGVSSGVDGSNTMGGTVHIITSEPGEDIPYTRLYSRWGSSGMENYGINFKNQNGSLHYSVFADKMFSHGFGIYKKYNVYNAVNFYSKTDWYYSPDTWFTMTAGKYEDKTGIPYSTGIESDKNKTRHVQIKYETHMAKTAFKIRFYGNDDRFERDVSGKLSVFENSTQGNEEMFEQDIGKYHLIRVGNEHKWNKLRGNFTQNEQTNLVNIEKAFYYEDEINLNNITFLFGERYDNNSSFKKEKSPRFKANYRIEPGATLFLSAGKGIAFPNINDLYRQDDYYKGNAGLITEKGWIYTLGFEKVFSDHLAINISTHTADINNFILWDYDSSLNYYQPKNVPSAITSGAETEIRFKIRKNLHIRSIYTYLITKDKETEKPLPYRPANKIKTNIFYESDKHNGDLLWTVSLSHEYQGIRYIERGKDAFLNSFTNINLNVSMVLAKAFTVNIAANNLEDRKYSIVNGYPMPGMNFWGGITWEFWN